MTGLLKKDLQIVLFILQNDKFKNMSTTYTYILIGKKRKAFLKIK